jgi:hypothetical protein
MDERTRQKLRYVISDEIMREKSLSKRATCIVCGKAIQDDERICLPFTNSGRSYKKYSHVGCYDCILEVLRNQKEQSQREFEEIPTKIKRDKVEQKVLEIWDSKENRGSYWTPEHGEILIPEGWEFLSTGNAYLTRTVRKLGAHWIKKRKDTKRRINMTVGTWAPMENIKKAQEMEKETETNRERKREKGRVYTEKREKGYREEFNDAVLRYLDFSDEYKDLAEEIAWGVSSWSCEKHSGRVGRTGALTLEQKAELATRAHIRHAFTNYEGNLTAANFGEEILSMPEEIYHQVKSDAMDEVSEFIRKHRKSE